MYVSKNGVPPKKSGSENQGQSKRYREVACYSQLPDRVLWNFTLSPQFRALNAVEVT